MANEIRVRQNFLGGLVEDNPLSSGATSMTSAGLSALQVIGSTQHLALTLDVDGVFGEPEIVYVTTHTGAATTATILRGQEGTTARQHNQDTPWVHGPTTRDFTGDTNWTAPAMSNSWVNFGAPYATVGYILDAAGFVHLRGLIKSGTTNTTVFTLPAGYRPEAEAQFVGLCNGTTAAVGGIDVTSAGVVSVTNYSSQIDLGQVTFKAFQ